MIFGLVLLVVGLFGCSEDPIEPMQDIPMEQMDPTSGDDDDRDCGQTGGC